MQNDLPKKNKSILLPILIAGGVVLIAAAVLLIVLLTGGSSIAGPWHSEALMQQLRFHDDDTVVIHTQYGVHEGSYVFDAKSGKGIITVDGKTLAFTASGDHLLLTDNGVEGEFVRGEMEIEAVFAEATPSVTPSASATPSSTATPAPTDSQAPQPTGTAAPTASATVAPTATPTTAPSASASPTPTFSNPAASLIPNPGGPGLSISIVGVWVRADNPGEKLEFNDDNTVSHTIPPSSLFGGEYTYDKTKREGVLYIQGREISFTVSGSKLTLDDGTVFKRE